MSLIETCCVAIVFGVGITCLIDVIKNARILYKCEQLDKERKKKELLTETRPTNQAEFLMSLEVAIEYAHEWTFEKKQITLTQEITSFRKINNYQLSLYYFETKVNNKIDSIECSCSSIFDKDKIYQALKRLEHQIIKDTEIGKAEREKQNIISDTKTANEIVLNYGNKI